MTESPQNSIHFLVSAPRSGTTWLMRALAQHPSIFATEYRLFGNYFDVIHPDQGPEQPRVTFDRYAEGLSVHVEFPQLGWKRAEFLKKYQRAYHRFLVRFCLRHADKQTVIDKITPYPGTSERVLASLEEFFPEAKIIELLRDGRDVATSGGFNWLRKDAEGTDRYRYFVQGQRAHGLPRFFDDPLIQEWARQWVEPIQTLESSGRARLQVRYEEMRADQANVLEKICQWLELPWTREITEQAAAAVTFEKMSGRAAGEEEPLHVARKGVSGDWLNYFTRRDGEIFHEIAGEQLLQLGFEIDPKWYEQLPEKLDL